MAKRKVQWEVQAEQIAQWQYKLTVYRNGKFYGRFISNDPEWMVEKIKAEEEKKC